MKQTFTKLFAALALLVSLAIPMGVWGQTRENYQGTFSRISNVSDFVTGYYVVTPSQSASTTNKALGNTVDNNKRIAGVNVTISNDQIVNPVNTVVYYITVSTSGSTTTCTFQNVNTGKYMYQASTTSGKGMGFSDDAVSITLAGYNSSSPIGFKFTLNGTSNNVFKWNNSSSWYANYSGEYTTSMTPVELYKLESTPSTDPVLSVDPASIDFGSVSINPSSAYEETFEVSFANLTQNLTVTGFSGVTVSPTTINYNANSPQIVTVFYNPTTAGSISGNISVNSSEVTEQLVAVTGLAYDPSNVVTYERYTGTLVEGDYIICANEEVAMKNVISSSRFANEAVTVTSGKITNPDASIIWHIAPDGDHWTIYNAAVNKYAAGTNSNNQGTLVDAVTDNARWDITYQYSNYTVICYGRNSSNNKYLRRNGTYGWATYTNSTGNVPTFYKKVITNQVAQPTFSVPAGTYFETQSVELSCETTGAIIYYTTDGTTPSASNGTEYTTAISVSSTMTIKAIAVKDGMAASDVATAVYTIELPLSTMDQIFAKATEAGNTATDVRISFNNWVVSGANDSSHTFVTDGTKGFMIYQSNHGFAAGDILSGTVQCKVQLYNGAAEITNLTSNTTGLTVTAGGNATVADIDMADLAAINTGALVSYENLTCSITTSGSYTNYYLTDGTTQIQAYSTLYSGLANSLEDGKTYNITGVFVQNNSTKRVNPRSAADIVEVTVPAVYTYSINGVEGQTIDAHVGETITLNEGQNLNNDYTFAGWSISATDMSNLLNGTYTLTDDVTVFYAVYAHTSNATVFAFTITPDAFVNQGGYSVNDGDHTSLATSATGETMNVTWSSSGVMLSQDGEIQFRKSSAGSISGTILGTITSVVVEEVSNGVLSASHEEGSFSIVGNGSATGYATSIAVSFTAGSTGYYTRIYTKDITGYGENKYGYCLIASPIDGVNPANVAGMTDDNFDLYRFNESAVKEWENWKQEGEHNHFNLERGKGYLYAHKTDVTLTFAGTPVQGTTFNVTLSKTTDAEYEGVNLVGNPFGQTAYIDRDFYVMNQAGSDFITSSGAIAPMQGIIVGAASHGEILTFTTEAPSNSGDAKVAINLSRNRGNVIDRAIVRFGEGSQLHKFQLRENSTKVYFTEGNQDFAVVRSQKAQGEMPVNFKAEENGTYTLSVNTEEMELNYLHLIDNMTGMDVDLLQTPSYTFDATTNDYASRFRLVFSANNEDGSSTGSEAFAFYSNGNWVIGNEGEATLQVIDVNGRIVSNETINGTVATSINATPGVYMLRLVNANEVKTQKIVVR